MEYFVLQMVAFYLVVINVLAFILFGLDKRKAKKGRWRISEATLLLQAAIGGSIGAWAGMNLFRHKTLHKKFRIGIPLLFSLQLGLCILLYLYC